MHQTAASDTVNDLSLSVELTGNPLALNEVCSLSMIDDEVNKKLAKETPVNPIGLFDYSRYRCLKQEELP